MLRVSPALALDWTVQWGMRNPYVTLRRVEGTLRTAGSMPSFCTTLWVEVPSGAQSWWERRPKWGLGGQDVGDVRFWTCDLVAWHGCGHQLWWHLSSAPDDSPVWAMPVDHPASSSCGPEAGAAGGWGEEGAPLGPWASIPSKTWLNICLKRAALNLKGRLKHSRCSEKRSRADQADLLQKVKGEVEFLESPEHRCRVHGGARRDWALRCSLRFVPCRLCGWAWELAWSPPCSDWVKMGEWWGSPWLIRLAPVSVMVVVEDMLFQWGWCQAPSEKKEEEDEVTAGAGVQRGQESGSSESARGAGL